MNNKEKRNEFIRDVYLLGINKLIESSIEFGRQEFKKEAIEELEHEKKKLTDGFAHPKDCKHCNK